MIAQSPWKILRRIFTSANFFPPAVSSTLQVFMVFVMNFMILWDILYILDKLLSSFEREPYRIPCRCQSTTMFYFFPSHFCSHLRCLVYQVFLLFFFSCFCFLFLLFVFFFVFFFILSGIRETVHCNKFPPLSVLLVFSTSSVDMISVYCCWVWFFFWDHFGLGWSFFSYPFEYICFFKSMSFEDRSEFIELEFHSFLFWVLLRANPGVFPPQGLLCVLVIFCHVIYPFGFSVMVFSFPYFTPKCALLPLHPTIIVILIIAIVIVVYYFTFIYLHLFMYLCIFLFIFYLSKGNCCHT